MLKTFIVSIAFVLGTIAFSAGATLSNAYYYFPFNPGDNIWKSFESHELRKEALEIPDNVLHIISTNNLLQVCLDYPYNIEAFAFDDIEYGFKNVCQMFNGYEELFSRDDFTETVSEALDSLPDIIEEIKNEDLITQGQFSIKLKILFYLLRNHPAFMSQEEYSSSINENMTRVVSQMRSYPDVFSLVGIPEPQSRSYGFDEPENGARYRTFLVPLPNGKQVEVSELISGELSNAEKMTCRKSIESYYGGEVLDDATNTYNCHGYAWYMYHEHDLQRVWMMEPDIYWKTGCYYEVDEKDAEIVVYGAVTHSARRIEKDVYISKWGNMCLVKHSPNNVIDNYGKPETYYKRFDTPNIKDPVIEGNSATYSLNVTLPKDFKVKWTLSDDYYAQNYMRINDDGECIITEAIDRWLDNATLTAQIYVKEELGWTVQKIISTSNNQSSNPESTPVYNINGNNPTYLIYPYIIYAKSGDVINISSPSFKKAITSYEGDITPSRWIWDEYTGKLTVALPYSNNGSAIVVHINCSDGTKYDIVILKRDSRMSLTTNIAGDILFLNIYESDTDFEFDCNSVSEYMVLQSYLESEATTLKEIDIMNIVTGKLVYSEKFNESQLTINVSGWEAGLYVVTVRCEDNILSEKITIK